MRDSLVKLLEHPQFDELVPLIVKQAQENPLLHFYLSLELAGAQAELDAERYDRLARLVQRLPAPKEPT